MKEAPKDKLISNGGTIMRLSGRDAHVEPYVACASLDGWYPVRVQSSNEQEFYTVLVNPWGDSHEYICECQGYRYRGQCRHQEVAHRFRCGWSSIDSRYSSVKQTDQQFEQMICPRCEGITTVKFRITT